MTVNHDNNIQDSRENVQLWNISFPVKSTVFCIGLTKVREIVRLTFLTYRIVMARLLYYRSQSKVRVGAGIYKVLLNIWKSQVGLMLGGAIKRCSTDTILCNFFRTLNILKCEIWFFNSTCGFWKFPKLDLFSE